MSEEGYNAALDGSYSAWYAHAPAAPPPPPPVFAPVAAAIASNNFGSAGYATDAWVAGTFAPVLNDYDGRSIFSSPLDQWGPIGGANNEYLAPLGFTGDPFKWSEAAPGEGQNAVVGGGSVVGYTPEFTSWMAAEKLTSVIHRGEAGGEQTFLRADGSQLGTGARWGEASDDAFGIGALLAGVFVGASIVAAGGAAAAPAALAPATTNYGLGATAAGGSGLTASAGQGLTLATATGTGSGLAATAGQGLTLAAASGTGSGLAIGTGQAIIGAGLGSIGGGLTAAQVASYTSAIDGAVGAGASWTPSTATAGQVASAASAAAPTAGSTVGTIGSALGAIGSLIAPVAGLVAPIAGLVAQLAPRPATTPAATLAGSSSDNMRLLMLAAGAIGLYLVLRTKK